jgi:hypothetical protein
MLEERRFKVNNIRPRKKIGLLISLDFLLTIPKKKPRIIKIDAMVAELTKANCAVTVVPILLPKITPKLLLKEITPVLTNTTAITVTAEEDCVMAVASAPTKVPMYLFLTNFAIISLNLSDARLCNSLLRFYIA